MAEHLFEVLAECVEEAVFVTDPSGRMLYANKALERMTGYTAADFQFRQADNPFLHPDDAARVGEFIAAFNASGAAVSGPVQNRFFDRWGQSHAYRSVLARVVWHGQPALQFVTRPVERESADDPMVRDFRALVENAGDGIVRLDAQGRVLFANQRFLSLISLDAVQVGHRAVADFVHPEDRSRAAAFLVPSHFTLRLRRAEGEPVWVDVNVTALSPGDERLALLRDVTEKRLLEQRLSHREKLESLGLMAGGVAHDFNNVLMVALGYASLADATLPPDAPARPYLEEIRKACDGAAAICKRMLAFSGRSPLDREPLELGAFVADMAELLRAGLAGAVTLEFERGDEAWVSGDKGALQSLVLNLVTNAAEALMGRPGQVTVSTTTRECTAAELAPLELGAGRAPGRYARLEVHDTGVGIDAPTQARLFEPFFTTKPSGHGLGLASVLGTVRGHGGALGIESGTGRGTRVVVYLPQLPHPATAGRKGPAAPQFQPAGVWLVVDDHPGVTESLAETLERRGFEVLRARDGEEALRLARAVGAKLEGAVLDVLMPGQSGPETVAQLRALRPGLPVVLMSGYLDRERPTSQVELLAKPFGADALLAAMGRAVARGRGGVE